MQGHNFNPPTSCEVGLNFWQDRRCFQISIHPPPARWDPPASDGQGRLWYFNPPTSCEVGLSTSICRALNTVFQSTHLLRGGTRAACPRWTPCRYFNPPTSCEVGRQESFNQLQAMEFQSTHLLRGGTGTGCWWRYQTGDFNPPTSCEVGHGLTDPLHLPGGISIHPPPARWDWKPWW